MKDFLDTRPVGLYDDALGSKNRDYYLDKFEDFDQKGDAWHPSWNWAAFFGGGAWALYRKMYGWFFAWWVVATFVTVFAKVPNDQIHQFLAIGIGVFWLGFTTFANSLYHRKVKARIASAQRSHSDASRVSRRLSAGGDVHAWVPIVFGAIPVICIVIAISLVAYKDYNKPKAVVVNPYDQYDKAISPPENSYGKFDPGTTHPVETIAPPASIKPKQAEEHLPRIYAAHADADAIYDSPNFKSWVEKYPTYQRILAQGSTQEIIDMFTAYKNQH